MPGIPQCTEKYITMGGVPASPPPPEGINDSDYVYPHQQALLRHLGTGPRNIPPALPPNPPDWNKEVLDRERAERLKTQTFLANLLNDNAFSMAILPTVQGKVRAFAEQTLRRDMDQEVANAITRRLQEIMPEKLTSLFQTGEIPLPKSCTCNDNLDNGISPISQSGDQPGPSRPTYLPSPGGPINTPRGQTFASTPSRNGGTPLPNQLTPSRQGRSQEVSTLPSVMNDSQFPACYTPTGTPPPQGRSPGNSLFSTLPSGIEDSQFPACYTPTGTPPPQGRSPGNSLFSTLPSGIEDSQNPACYTPTGTPPPQGRSPGVSLFSTLPSGIEDSQNPCYTPTGTPPPQGRSPGVSLFSTLPSGIEDSQNPCYTPTGTPPPNQCQFATPNRGQSPGRSPNRNITPQRQPIPPIQCSQPGTPRSVPQSRNVSPQGQPLPLNNRSQPFTPGSRSLSGSDPFRTFPYIDSSMATTPGTYSYIGSTMATPPGTFSYRDSSMATTPGTFSYRDSSSYPPSSGTYPSQDISTCSNSDSSSTQSYSTISTGSSLPNRSRVVSPSGRNVSNCQPGPSQPLQLSQCSRPSSGGSGISNSQPGPGQPLQLSQCSQPSPGGRGIPNRQPEQYQPLELTQCSQPSSGGRDRSVSPMRTLDPSPGRPSTAPSGRANNNNPCLNLNIYLCDGGNEENPHRNEGIYISPCNCKKQRQNDSEFNDDWST